MALLPDDNSSEGTEQFNIILSMSRSVTNVILDPNFATVFVSDSVESILEDLSIIADSSNQTEDNIQFIGGVVEDIANSASNGELEISMEVRIIIILCFSVILCPCNDTEIYCMCCIDC